VVVGDPAQAIYGFRGADSDSLDLIAQEFNCIQLPLTVSYRCPTKVIDFARQYVSHIEAAPNAAEGAVTDLEKWSSEIFRPNDLVVCRTTKALIALGYTMLKDRKPFYIMGRDIGQGLKSLINKMNAKGIDHLITKLEAWRGREVTRLTAKGQDAKVDAINDKVDAVLFLIDGLQENKRNVSELCSIIDSMFSERANATILATIHKAKGLEASTVYWLNSSQCPAKWARQDWQQRQELNLCYVAVTRAKQQLILIEEKRDAA
jgi:DNA helicase-2/ATP-dependent DNA helicase PcrA